MYFVKASQPRGKCWNRFQLKSRNTSRNWYEIVDIYIEKFWQIFAEMNEMVNEMVSAVDDGDGEIDYDEFVSMIQKY